MKKLLFLSVFILTVYFSYTQETFPVIKVTENDYDDSSPGISFDGKIVWYGKGGLNGTTEIYLYEDGEIRPLTNNAYNDSQSSISLNGEIVWIGESGPNGYGEVYRYINDQTSNISNNLYRNLGCKVSSDGKIVWFANAGTNQTFEILLYDMGQVINISNNNFQDYNPKISPGGKIVWRGFGGWNHPASGLPLEEIYLYSDGQFQRITANYSDDFNPQVSDNGEIVWCGLPSQFAYPGVEPADIFLYSQGNTIKISNNKSSNYSPVFSPNGKYIVWYGNGIDTGTKEIYLYSDGQTQKITDDYINDYDPSCTSNGVIVWRTISGNLVKVKCYYKGNTYIISEGMQSTSLISLLDNGKMAWSGRSGTDTDTEIYVAYLDWRAPDITETLIDANSTIIPEDSWINTDRVTLTVTAADSPEGIPFGVDETSWEHREGDDPWAAGNVEYIFSDEGIHTVSYRVKDLADNISEKSIAVKIDRTPPSIQAFGTGPDNWSANLGYKATVTGNDGNGSGIRSWWYSKLASTGPWLELTGALEVNGFGVGVNEVWFRAIDGVGLESVVKTQVNIDITSPSITLTNDWVASPYMPQITDSGGSGLDPDFLQYSFDGINYYPGSAVFSSSGTQLVYLRTRDLAGNETTKSGNIRCDMTGPVITYTQSTNDQSGDVTFTANATDAHVVTVDEASWQKRLGDGDWEPGNSFTVAGNQSVTFGFKCADILGNETILEETIIIDSETPVVTVTPSISSWTNASSVSVTASAIDNIGIRANSWEYILNDMEGTWITAADPSIPINISMEGETTVYFRVSDTSGNIGIGSAMVRIDRSSPSFTSFVWEDAGGQALVQDGNGNAWTNSSSVILVAEVTDDVAGKTVSGVDTVLWSLDLNTPIEEWNTGEISVSAEGINTVWVKVTDIASNDTTVNRLMRIDRTAPEVVSCTLDDSYVKNSIVLAAGQPQMVDDLSSVDADSFEYSFDDTDIWSSLTQSISVAYLSEGAHTFSVRCRDLAGNTGVIPEGVSFIIDRTDPVITNIVIKSDSGKIIEENDYAPSSTVIVEMEASDTYGSGLSGNITDYNWGFFSSPQSSPILINFVPEGSDFYVSGLANGANYFYVSAKDDAGNDGNVNQRIIRVDSSVPPMPVITSPTHPYAQNLTDAVSVNDAVFNLVSTGSGAAGIDHYEYTLSSGFAEPGLTVIPLSAATGNRIELTLDDNLSGEYYFLRVQTVSGNGKSSVQATYKFRIDSTPPKNLTVTSTTHGNPDLYYQSKTAVVQWNRPADFTGVEWYFYELSQAPLFPDPMPEEYQYEGDMTGWMQTKDLSASVNLQTVTGSNSGTVWVSVCAQDYAGNRQFNHRKLKFDSEKPVMDSLVTVLPDINNGSVFVQWSELQDNIIEADYLHTEIRLAVINGEEPEYLTNTIYKNAIDTNHTFEGLSTEPALTYGVMIKAVDGAGNTAQVFQGFTFASGAVVLEISEEFTQTMAGYTVRGVYNTNPDSREAYLIMPASFSFKVNNEPVTEVQLTTISFDEKTFSGGSNSAISCLVELNGYMFAGVGISINETDGLVFTELSRTITTSAGINKTLTFANVSVSAPPLILFSDTETAEAESFGYQSLSEGESGTDPTSGFLFSGISVTGLSQRYFRLNYSLLDLSSEDRMVTAYTLDSNNTRSYMLPVTNTSIGPAGDVIEGTVAGIFYLETGGNLFKVTNALVRENRLVILEAEVLFADGFTTDVVKLYNFSIDLEGNLTEGPDFSYDPFEFMVNGITYTVNALHFQGNLLTVTDGSLTMGTNNTVSISALTLKQDGIDYNQPTDTGAYSGSFFDFEVTAITSKLVPEGLLLPVSTLRLTPAYDNATNTLYDLTVSLSGTSITQEGKGSTSLSLDCSYGTGVVIKELSLKADGLYATELEVPLPTIITSGTNVLSFKGLRLDAQGPAGESETIDEVSFDLNDYHLTGYDVSFNGTKVSFGRVEAPLTEEYSPDILVFESFSVNKQGVVDNGICTYSIGLEAYGWIFDLTELQLTAEGITGQGNVQLGYAFGHREITFGQFKINPDGEFSTGTADTEVYIRLCGWLCRATDISFEPAVEGVSNIKLGFANVILHSIMGFEELSVPDVVITPEGTILSSEQGNEIKTFLSTNGFTVDTDKYTFSDDCLMIGGKINLPPALGTNKFATYENCEIRLEPDGAVISLEKIPPSTVTYNIAGWDVTGENYLFDREGFFVGLNTINLFNSGVSVVLPNIRFYPDGQIKLAGMSFEGFSFNPIGGPIELGVTAIQLSDDGLNIKAYVGLPEGFGAEYIYFDKLTVHPDGTVTSDVVVPEFHFELEGFAFLFKNIVFDETGFRIDEASITLPENLDSRVIRISDLRITNEGDFVLGGLYVDPFELWGYLFYIDSISFKDDKIGFTGGIRLPTDFVMESLAGKRIDIEKFEVSLDGQSFDFKVSINDTFSFKILDAYTLNVTNVSIEREILTIEDATLELPPELNVDSASVGNIAINVLTGEIDIGEITLSGISFNFEGYEFYVDTLTLSESEGLVFQGNVKLPDDFPSGIGGKTITVNKFQINTDMTIGDVDASFPMEGMELFDGNLIISEATLTFIRENNNLVFGCSNGHLSFGPHFSSELGISNAGLEIHEFKMGIVNGIPSVLVFNAESDPLSFHLFNISEVTNARIGLHYENGITFSITGGNDQPARIKLGSNFSDDFEPVTLVINEFHIDSSGHILQPFIVGADLTGERKILGDIRLVDGSIAANLSEDGKTVEFRIKDTSVKFGPSFPEGLAEKSIDIEEVAFNSKGEVLNFNLEFDVSDLSCFPLERGTIRISKYGEKDVLLSLLNGRVRLPGNLPSGLADLPIDINEFSILSSGQILNVSVTTQSFTVTLFNNVTYTNNTFTITSKPQNELIFALQGDILASTLPDPFSEFGKITLNVEYSTVNGLTEFSATAQGYKEYELFAGIKASFSSFGFDLDGIFLSGTLTFPQDFGLDGLNGLSVTMTELRIGWNGQVKNIIAGVDDLITFAWAGFTIDVTGLNFHVNGITMDLCQITLPEIVSTSKITIKEAGIDSNGHFFGEFAVPLLQFDFTGFLISLHDPSLDFANKKLSFSKTQFLLPQFMGGFTIDLGGVSVSPDGVEITGGQIRIPDFTIAGGLWFMDMMIEFSSEDGEYRVDGTGSVMVPGAGTLNASISFVPVSRRYPWGIESALFKYKIWGLGIPLGATGMYLNEIRGGFAFGPPREIPSKVRGMFDEGMRIQLGVSIVDQTGGDVVKAGVDLWIDITDWEWAFQGNISILHGLAKGELIAALTKKGFYGYVGVELVFVRGSIELYVFQLDGVTNVNGSGRIQFGLRTGSIWHWSGWILWWHVTIDIPPFDLWLPGMGADFGTFTNGQEGFRGFIDVPIFGQIGIFVPSSGGFVLGDVSRYTLYNPFAAQESSKGLSAVTMDLGLPVKQNRVFNMDKMEKGGTIDKYNFRVSGTMAPTGLEINTNRGLYLETSTLLGDTDPSAEVPVERIIFVVSYPEGDPVVTPISPSGRRYSLSDTDVLYERKETGLMIAILNPEAGEWTCEVSNVINSDAYRIDVFGKAMTPSISLNTPSLDRETVGDTYTVRGTADLHNGATPQVKIYLGTTMGTYVGKLAAETSCTASGDFSADINTQDLLNGEYFVYAGVQRDPDSPEMRCFAQGSLIVNNTTPLAAVTEFTAQDNNTGGIDLAFKDSNGDSCAGFNLYVDNMTSGESRQYWIGYVTEMTLPGFSDSETIRLTVAPVDNTNREGVKSSPVTVVMGDAKDTINVPQFIQDTL
ncbi:MAG: hypothetical protein JW969_04190, partial [Spirochaetales bacterium]|nr:hypothetical protein [Spirochaetales bacterium]